jgi:pimeloyl-ACP methyl ester carboxylesterase
MRVEKLRVPLLNESARVYVGGEGEPALLLLHGGWGDAATHWSRVWHRLARSTRVVAPDLPGLGETTQEGRASLAEYVAWLTSLLDAIGIKKVVCIGNSFGASVAWSFAGRCPNRCAGVVLVDGVPMPRTPGPLRWLGHRAVGRRLMRRAVQRWSFTPDALPRAFSNPELAPKELETSVAVTPPRRLETFIDCLIEGDGPPPPHTRVLVLWGEADHLPGTGLAAGKRLSARLPGARFVSLPGAGHFPQLERPELFARAIESFLGLHTPLPSPVQLRGIESATS